MARSSSRSGRRSRPGGGPPGGSPEQPARPEGAEVLGPELVCTVVNSKTACCRARPSSCWSRRSTRGKGARRRGRGRTRGPRGRRGGPRRRRSSGVSSGGSPGGAGGDRRAAVDLGRGRPRTSTCLRASASAATVLAGSVGGAWIRGAGHRTPGPTLRGPGTTPNGRGEPVRPRAATSSRPPPAPWRRRR